MLHRAACDELEARSRIAFESFARAHAALMPTAREVRRDEVKTFLRDCVLGEAAAISPLLDTELRKITDDRTIERAALDLVEPTSLSVRKLEIEIDLYFDQLENLGT